MTRLRGRCRRGHRLHATAPHGHWHTTTLIGSIRLDGSSAAMTIEGATDTDVFTAYVRHVLVPSLRPGDIVVMDNLAPHKSPQVCALIEAAGGEALFLPPYSPDFNPIEKMWSKLKALLRRAAARTRESLLVAIADAIAQVTAEDARGWFVSCGYSFI